jgi:hypothetical protein
MSSIRHLAAAAAIVVVVLLGAGDVRAGTPTVNANANGNVDLNGQIKVDIQGLEGVVTQIDGDLARLLRTAQSQARDDIVALLTQTKSAINDQLAQISSASTAAINLVAGQIDAQLKTVLGKVQALHQQTLAMISEVEHDIANHLDNLVQGLERQVLVQLQQIHQDLLQTLQVIGSFIDQQLDRLYVRTDDGVQQAAYQSRAFVDSAAMVIARGLLGALLLVLVLRVARQTAEAIRKPEKFPLEPVAGGVVLIGVAVLLISKPLLAGVLGIPATPVAPSLCSSAWTDYGKFVDDSKLVSDCKSGVTCTELRYEGVTVQEELKRCEYVSVSQDRAAGADQLLTAVRSTLAKLPDSVSASVAKK